MTREEAIEVLKLVEENASCDDCLYYAQMEDCPTDEDCIIVQASRMAIKALSQEPTEKPMTVDEMEREYEKSKALFHKIVECDDAISREAAINIASLHCLTIDETVKAIKNLPSVTQLSAKDYLDMADRKAKKIKDALTVTQKSGKWERHYIRPNVYKDLLWYCSACGKGCGYNNAFMFDYCPNCGAKMESEDKE